MTAISWVLFSSPTRVFLLGIVLLCLFAHSSLSTAAEKTLPSTKQHPVTSTLSAIEREHLLSSMVFVEGGNFIMGSNTETARAMEKPAHQVTLSDFYMGKTEVTQALFERIMAWNHSYFSCPQCPVNNISWSNAYLFIERLNAKTGLRFSLPTEAQWEYAAKGGKHSKGYLFSGSNDIGEVAWFAGNAQRKSHPVAQKKANELGLYDMTGNLWEFCLDDISRKAYHRSSAVDPLIISSSSPKAKAMKVIRGSGYEFAADESEVFKRDGATNNVRMPDIGFRLVLKEKIALKEQSGLTGEARLKH